MDTNSNNDLQLKTFFQLDRREAGPLSPPPGLIGEGYRSRVELETIISRLQPVIETQGKTYLAAWKQNSQDLLNQGVAILARLPAALEQLDPDTVAVADLWRELAVTCDAIHDRSGRLDRELSAPHVQRTWQRQFLECLQTVPAYAEIPIPPNFWRAKPDDSWPQRWQKARGRVRANLNQAKVRLGTQFRALIKAGPLDPLPAHRIIHLHSFLACYVGLPVAEFLGTQWLQFLQQLAGQLDELVTTCGAIKAEFLPLEDFEAAISKFDPARLNHKLECLQNHLQLIGAQSERLDQFEIEAGLELEAFLADLFREMRQQWQLAGAYQLPDSSFDQQQVDAGWHRLESQAEAAHRRWLDHFRDQQQEWQARLAVWLLQLAAAQMCQRRLAGLERRIRQQLIPPFATARETTNLLSEEITALRKKNPATLKQALAEQIRSILEVLQQDKLPGLMDELITAQLAPAAGGETASSVRRALAAISGGHRTSDRGDPKYPFPPSPANSLLTLKKLVLEHLLPELEQGYRAVTAENRQLMEKLIQGIAEMDQVIEVNLKQAAAQLTRRQDPESIEETRLAIITELNRTAQQLGELVAQAEQLLADSRRNLVQATGEFETQLEPLTGTGQISEVYLHLAGQKGRGKIGFYRRRLYLTLKTAIPNLVGLLGNTYQQFQSSYARLREMAGSSPDKAEAQENLAQFLIDTEKHISALPYFYQRLFRLEPLDDEQFFTARTGELATLKTEFERWQSGRFAATAIIGERGSGISSLLNIAEKQLYQDYPVLKIDFLEGETIYTEAALFDFLKSIFKATDLKRGLKNMDELENKINTLEDQKIFIVENLQQLFLRTPHGFDALERFLLFMSRTHQKIHWVITCAIYSWEYLAKVIDIDEYVQQKIILNGLSPEEFKNIILTRHRMSSYQLQFQPTDKIAGSRRYRKLGSEQARQTYLQEMFFKQLGELAAGNITVAILLWLRSYVEFSQDRLCFPAAIQFDPTFLYQLSTEELFTLAAVLQHDILTAEHHALIFHQDLQPSLLLLNRMANKGFLVQKPNGYQIHPFLYRPVVGVLKSGNIIH